MLLYMPGSCPDLPGDKPQDLGTETDLSDHELPGWGYVNNINVPPLVQGGSQQQHCLAGVGGGEGGVLGIVCPIQGGGPDEAF